MSDILREIESFCAEHKLTDGQFGLMALNDKNFVPQLRDGRDIRLSTGEKVRAFMEEFRNAAA